MTGTRRSPEARRLTVVLAQWCPHCVPLSVKYGQRLAKSLGIPFRVLDIDRRGQVKLADQLVREYGDASPDYLIPQVFLEWTDGRVQQLLTGFSEQVPRTERAWRDLLASGWLRSVREGRGP